MYTSTFLLALGLAAQGAVATGGWGTGKSFACPGNTPTTCSNDQSSGFSWGTATVGQQVSTYGGCGFSGVTCQAQGPGGKLSKRTAGASDKCVQGPIHGDASSCPKMSAGKGSGAGEDFSPTNYHVSCSYDTQVDFVYSMKDGSTCKHTSPCQSGGNTVQNTQCGGAVSVSCQQNSGEKTKNKGKECQMGIHSVGFQCGPATSITPPKSSSTPATKPATSSVATHPQTTPVTQSKPATESKPATTPVSSKPATESKPGSTVPATTPVSSKPATESKPASTVPATTPVSSKPATTPVSSKPATECTPGMTAPGCSVPGTTAPGQTTPVASSKPVSSTAGVPIPPYQPPANSSVPVQTTPVQQTTPVASSKPATSSFATTTFMTTSTVFHTTEITVTSCAASITNCPAESKTPMVITSTLSSFVTVCPVTATLVPSGSSLVPVVVPSSAPGATTPVATSKPLASSSAPGASTPSSPAVPLNCPDVVPSCINTLLQTIQTECQNNADSSCFCAASNHTQFIQECIVSHGADASEVQTALSYLQGLCAPQVPQNPSIITHQPEGVPQVPIVPSGIPATTITIAYTTTVPCSATNAPVTSAPAAGTPAAGTPAVPTIVNTITSVSMTVMTVQSTVTVPQVQVTAPPAAPGAATTPAAALVPGYGATTAAPATQGPPATQPAAPAQPATPAAAATTPAAAAGTPAAGVPAYGVPAVASTGGVSRPTGTINPPIATGAAGKLGVSFGAAAVAVALLL